MHMKKIVYLIGAGATQAEMALKGIKSDITMNGISENVYELSKNINGKYYELMQDFGIQPKEQDIELIMSLFEGYADPEESDFNDVYKELRALFRNYLVSQITDKKIVPILLSSLLCIHKNYGKYMGKNGEKIKGILTINYDRLIEESFLDVYSGLNYWYKFKSNDYKRVHAIPPLLKLHGSFNWKIQNDKLEVSKKFESDENSDDHSGWIPPSVYKKPSENSILKDIWNKASNLLIDCDILRVVGSSLRNEDFALISLIFNSQIKSDPTFDIELIVPDRSALGDSGFTGIMQRLSFLGNIKYLSSLPVFERGEIITDNVFHLWLLKKIKEVEIKNDKISEDKFINKIF